MRNTGYGIRQKERNNPQISPITQIFLSHRSGACGPPKVKFGAQNLEDGRLAWSHARRHQLK
jgi:hypothetical protein